MLLVIGLDGGTWKLIDPWIAAGALPNLARLRQRGCHGDLRSTTPPATMPSWTSFATGVNPGRHGIFDFTRRQFGTREVRFVNATFRKAPSIWRMLSQAGKRVAVVGVPGTYPPEDLNGCMISGFDTPVTTRADDSFVKPRELASLMHRCGGFPFADFQEFVTGEGWHAKARSKLLEGIEKKTRLACALLERGPWDCFVLVFGESDTASHHFWHLYDRRSPRYDAAAADQLGDTLFAIYAQLDAAIGEIEARAQPEAVMILSDHGFGGAGDRAIHINRLLVEIGFQRRSDPRTQGWAGGLKRLALTAIPAHWQAQAFRLGGGRWAGRLESRARFSGIAWDGTRAFSEELNYFPSVWLNLIGRDPDGTVSPADYERVRDEVCTGLESFTDPLTRRPVVERAWRREELYHGDWVADAPDIILELALVDGYSYTCLPTTSSSASIRTMERSELLGGKASGMGGSHRPEGMFLFTGAGSGLVHGARIEDMGATVLAQCGIDPSMALDGRPVIAAAPGCEPIDARGENPEQVYSPAEEAEIEQRLGALGYLQ